MKTCQTCQETKPISDFYAKGGTRKGHHARCKPCHKAQVNATRKAPANLERDRLRRKEWQVANADYRSTTARIKTLARYGLNEEGYAGLLEAQEGVCAVCRKACSLGRLAIDHDHSCCPGEGSCGACIRGLLCRACNLGIGNLGDDADRVQAAADYLRASR